MNAVSIIGRFAKDPELRYSQSGTAICNFILAVRNPFSKDNEADFISCVAWGSGAELVADKHIKGNMIGIEGRIATRNYENNEGVRIYVTEVNVNSIHLIQTKDYAENQQNNNTNNQQNNNQQNSRQDQKGNSQRSGRSGQRTNR